MGLGLPIYCFSFDIKLYFVLIILAIRLDKVLPIVLDNVLLKLLFADILVKLVRNTVSLSL